MFRGVSRKSSHGCFSEVWPGTRRSALHPTFAVEKAATQSLRPHSIRDRNLVERAAALQPINHE